MDVTFLVSRTTQADVLPEINLYFGWIWVLAGLVSGTIVGLFFFDDDWFGGYGSWRRRIVRLGHISFLGTGLLNLAYFFTVRLAGFSPLSLTSWLFLLGGATMPTVCFLSAWSDAFRRLFFIPVLCLLAAVTDLLLRGRP